MIELRYKFLASSGTHIPLLSDSDPKHSTLMEDRLLVIALRKGTPSIVSHSFFLDFDEPLGDRFVAGIYLVRCERHTGPQFRK